MAQQPLGPPPRVETGTVFDRWMNNLWNRISVTGQILWTQIIEPTVVKNTFFAGPTTGADAQADFRAIVAADLGTGTPNGTKFLRDDLTWQLPSSGATSNIISASTTINADTSYIVIDYLNIEAEFIVEGMVEVI